MVYLCNIIIIKKIILLTVMMMRKITAFFTWIGDLDWHIGFFFWIFFGFPRFAFMPILFSYNTMYNTCNRILVV